MPPTPSLRCLLLVLLPACVPLARAQHFLVVVDPAGKPQLVRAATVPTENKTTAMATKIPASVEIAGPNGGLQIVPSSTFRFPAAPIWGAGLVDVSHLTVEIEAGQSTLHAHGYLTADRALPNCVLVILAKSPATKNSEADNEILFEPVPDTGKEVRMPANDSVLFDHEWSLLPHFDDVIGTAELHFFSNGMEIPTSRMTAEEVAAARAKTEAYLLRDHPNSGIALVSAVRPAYPDSLKGRNLAGTATLRCRIDRDGDVAAVTVVAATDPAFGEAAAAAVRQWKFSPAVANHRYVEQVVEFPVNFKAPNP